MKRQKHYTWNPCPLAWRRESAVRGQWWQHMRREQEASALRAGMAPGHPTPLRTLHAQGASFASSMHLCICVWGGISGKWEGGWEAHLDRILGVLCWRGIWFLDDGLGHTCYICRSPAFWRPGWLPQPCFWIWGPFLLQPLEPQIFKCPTPAISQFRRDPCPHLLSAVAEQSSVSTHLSILDMEAYSYNMYMMIDVMGWQEHRLRRDQWAQGWSWKFHQQKSWGQWRRYKWVQVFQLTEVI